MNTIARLIHGTTCAAFCAALNPAAAQAPDLPDERESTAVQQLEEIVVTGSRILRTGADTPTPTTVIDAQAIRSSGVTEIADLINQTPSLFITQTNQTSNQQGNAGLNALDLRGLGTERTLALVNSRRRVPGIPGTSAIDVSTIPVGLVERVEVITGGASALYGADAVAGVTNFILKDDFGGLQASGSYGGSTRGDLGGYDIDILAGTNFADGRGNVTGFAAYSDHSNTASGQDRPWTARGTPLYFRQPDGTFRLTDDNHSIYDHVEAVIELGGRGNLYTFTPEGELRTPELGPGGILNLSTTSTNLSSYRTDGGEFLGRYDDWVLRVPTERVSAYGVVNYELTESLAAFADIAYSQTDSRGQYRAQSAYGFDMVPVDSPFITDEMITANGGPITAPIGFTRRYTEMGVSQTVYDRSMVQATTGLEGNLPVFGQEWTWSTYYSYGQTRQDVQDTNASAANRYFLALDSTTDGSGNPVCRSTLSDPGNGCVPLNPFRTLTQDVMDYLLYDSSPARHELTQQVLSGYMTGDLFSLPAGPVQAVLGAEYRRESNDIGATPEYDPTSPQYDPTIGITEVPLVGKYDVKEVFAEIRVPILTDRPLFRQLSFESAIRHSDYSTAGATTAYKYAADWAPVGGIRFRGTYGQAVRAPNISEIFTSTRIGGQWVTDPCNDYNVANRTSRSEYTEANCAAIDPGNTVTYWLWREIISTGNADLNVETATTLTAGVVLQPTFTPNLSLTIDYYDIDLEDAIDAFGAQLIMEKCVDAPSLDNMFCGYVTRDADNNLVSIETRQLNLSRFTTRGIDFELNYSLERNSLGLGENSGKLAMNAVYTKLLQRDFILDPSDPNTISETVGLFGSPKWKGAIRTTYDSGPLALSWTARHYSKMRPGTDVTPETHDVAYTDDIFYHDVYGSFDITQRFSFFAGLRNALDQEPPRLPGAEAGGANFEFGYQSGLYDVIGRTFYVGVEYNSD